MKLPDARTLDATTQEQLRLRAIHAIEELGMTQQQAADLVGVTRQSVNAWMKAYREGGQSALRSHRRGRRPGHKKLRPWQAAQIARTLRKAPDELDLPFTLWTRESVRDLIEQRFGIHLALTTTGNYLRRWGFTAQKPIRRALERDPQAVQAWLDQEYPAIEARAKVENALIFWGDEVGFRSRDHVGRSYGLKGQTPVITATDKRFGCNAIIAVAQSGQMRWMVFDGSFDEKVFIEYLKRLVGSAPDGRKVFLIVDGHPSHRSKKVKQWIEDHQAEIELFFLPGYSPNLNPAEYVNNELKSQGGVRKGRLNDKQSLMGAVRRYLRILQSDVSRVAQFFLAPDVQYASSS